MTSYNVETVPPLLHQRQVGSAPPKEIRVQVGNDIFHIFCFFDRGNVVVIGRGFTKKTQKTPKAEYYESL